MRWNENDYTIYNKAKSPWFDVSQNGKVDICDELGKGERKISLQPWGMYKLVHEWLNSNHNLTREQKDKLINLLK